MSSKVLRGDTGGGGSAPVLHTDVQTADQTPASTAYEDSEMSITLTAADGDILDIVASGNVYSATGQAMNPFVRISIGATVIREAFLSNGATTTTRAHMVLGVRHPISSTGSYTVKVEFRYPSGTAPTFTGGDEDQDQRWRLQILQFSA